MTPRITVLTLGVSDLQGSLKFYRDGLGFATPGVVGTEFEHGAVAFFEPESGMQLALWPISSLAHDAGLELPSASAPRISLGHNVRSLDEVDTVYEQARRAGATVVKEPAASSWGGYAGYFRDPDDYLREVAWNPNLLPPDASH